MKSYRKELTFHTKTRRACPNGIQLLVTHVDKDVRITAETNTDVLIPLDEYKEIIKPFVQEIEQVYKQNPRKLPKDEFERNGYTAFWNEWRGLRQRIFGEV